MTKERIIAEVETVEDARKVEETVKTGYAEPSIETLVQWMAVEEDLAASYELLSAKPENAPRRGAFEQLANESKKNLEVLSELRKSFETLDRARVQRINLLSSMSP
jgi:hypothetical protein